MKKIISIFVISAISLTLIACGDKKQEQNTSKDSVSQTTENKQNEEKIYKQGETAIIKNQQGQDLYSLTINNVKQANDFEYRSDFNGTDKEVVEVDYTYKDINTTDMKLEIHGADLQVIDNNGTVASSSDMFPKGKPEAITKGVNCNVQAYYGLKNESNKVKIIFTSKKYRQMVTFEVPVEK